MNKAGLQRLLLGALLACVAGTGGERMPTFPLTSLSSQAVTLPDKSRGQVAILIIGFTSASAKATTAWRQKIEPDLGRNTGVAIYPVAILEDVPRLIRSLVVGSIRKGTPAGERDRFLITFQNEKEWKQLVGYSQKDDAYLVILDAQGTILWQTHGLGTDAQYAGFRERAGAWISKKP